MRRYNSQIGAQYGKLTVLRFVGSNKYKVKMYECQCVCGKKIITRGTSLRSGNTKSCGCSRGESIRTHGEGTKPTFEYRVWAGIVQRCCNPNCRAYPDYGGRGIKICSKWRESFEAFLEDVGRSPSLDHSLDRFPDNDGNYEPGNVRWATLSEQGRNRRTNRLITFNGETHCATEWAEILNMPFGVLFGRLACGWSIEKCLTTPYRPRSYNGA